MTEPQANKIIEILNNLNISVTMLQYLLLGTLIAVVVYILVMLIKKH